MKSINATHPATLYMATNATSMRCQLFNVTYTIDLSFDGNDQVAEWEYNDPHNAIVALSNYSYHQASGIPDPAVLQTLSWRSIM